MIKNLLLVGLGGGIGSIARYLCQRWFSLHTIQTFPWGTFSVNILGCFLIGLLWGISMRVQASFESWQMFLMAGVCGGFTTFSAFTLESIGLIKEQKLTLLFLYVLGSVVAGLLATFIGIRIIK